MKLNLFEEVGLALELDVADATPEMRAHALDALQTILEVLLNDRAPTTRVRDKIAEIEAVGESSVEIPGNFTATYSPERGITRLVFMPAASYAGFIGTTAEVSSGDHNLDVEDVDGPFWRAVQAALQPGEVEEIPHAVPIQWEE